MVNQPGDNAETWREKYLQALDTQEQLEQQARDNYQLLRRALIQTSLVADGQDPELDKLLDGIREALRQDSASPPVELLTALDRQIHDMDDRRQKFDGEIRQALSQLASGLRAVGVSPDLKAELGHYLSRLPARCQKISLYPALLEQLASLQAQTLTELRGTPRPNLIQRLRGVEPTPQEVASDSLRAEIGETLHKIVSTLDGEQVPAEQLQGLKKQVAKGLHLHELPSLLEQTRELIVKAWLASQNIFAHYLDKVNRELAEIAEVLGGAVASETRRVQARTDIQDVLERECQTIESGVAEARDLQQLKRQVASQLGKIRAAVSQFRASESEGSKATEQLQHLAERVKIMEQEAEVSRSTLQQHRHKALHDPLTKLPNREAYDERIRHELQRWQRYGHPLTLAVVDIDHFKKINDSFGHQAGDRVLKVISRAIGKRLREVDFFSRYGGEEFVVLMPETSAQEAFRVLDFIRSAIAETNFNYQQTPLTITLCMGIAEFQPGDTPDEVFGRADRALYAAKADGRNQCRLG